MTLAGFYGRVESACESGHPSAWVRSNPLTITLRRQGTALLDCCGDAGIRRAPWIRSVTDAVGAEGIIRCCTTHVQVVELPDETVSILRQTISNRGTGHVVFG